MAEMCVLTVRFKTEPLRHMQTPESHPLSDSMYRVADKSLARPGRKQAKATEDFDVHISYL